METMNDKKESKNPYWTGCRMEDCEYWSEYIAGGYMEPIYRDACGHPLQKERDLFSDSDCPRTQMTTEELINDLAESAVKFETAYYDLSTLMRTLMREGKLSDNQRAELEIIDADLKSRGGGIEG
jgi:hypothetical protein